MAEGTLGTFLRQIRNRVGAPAAGEPSDAQLLERFRAGRDQAAFELLLQRHGPLVQGVCRRVLRDPQDADDAFQATFLVLVRRAGSLGKKGSLAGWLYTVAYHIALRARADAARRRRHEGLAVTVPVTDPPPDVLWRDLRPVLDEEVNRLPEKYRAPAVLCYLQGNTYAEAARLLGWSPGTVSGRLARARALLRRRLTRRGLAPVVGLLGAGLGGRARAAVPAGLAAGTLRSALGAAVAPRAAALAEAVLGAMLRARVRTGAVVVLLLGLLAGGAGLAAWRTGPAAPPGARQPAGPGEAGEGRDAKPDSRAAARTDPHGVPLPPDALARFGVARARNGDKGESRPLRLAFSPDGKTLAVGDWDCAVRLWDVATDRLLLRYEAHQGGITALGFSPDGKLLASGSIRENVVHLWDAATGRTVRRLEGHEDMITGVAFSPDGELLASAANDKTYRLWETATGKQLQQISLKELSLHGHVAAFSPDGKLLALPGVMVIEGNRPAGNGAILIWDVSAGKELRRLADRFHSVATAAFLPGGKTLVSGDWGDPAQTRLWDVATGTEIRHFGGGECAAISADGATLATRAAGAIQLRDAATGDERCRLQGEPGEIGQVAFSPDGKTLATAGLDRTVRLWDAATGKELRQVGGGPQDTVISLAFSADGKRLAAAGEDDALRFWEPGSGKEVHRLRGRFGALSRDGKAWAVIRDDRQVMAVRDAATNQLLQEFATGNQAQYRAVAFSPDGKLLASGDHKSVRLWDVATGRKVGEVPTRAEGRLGFAPDGRLLVVTHDSAWGPYQYHAVSLWEVATGKQRPLDEGAAAFLGGDRSPFTPGFAFSADGKTLAAEHTTAGRGEDSVCLWDTATGKVRRRWACPDGARGLIALTFSPDGKTLAGAGVDSNTVWLWEAATGLERGRLEGHADRVLAVAFSPDGKSLASGSADTTVLLWDWLGLSRAAAKPARHELDDLWDDLGRDKGDRAYRALRTLLASPGAAVPYLAGRVGPAEAAVPRRLERLIADLDHDDFKVRERASAELERFGELARPALEKCRTDTTSPEVRRRTNELLARLEREDWSGERLRSLRAIEVLEYAGTPEARQVLEKLAAGPPEERLTRAAKDSLDRLARHHPPSP